MVEGRKHFKQNTPPIPDLGRARAPLDLVATKQGEFVSAYCFDEISILADLLAWSDKVGVSLKQGQINYDYSSAPLLSTHRGGNCLSLSSSFLTSLDTIGIKCKLVPSWLDENAVNIAGGPSHRVKTVGLVIPGDPPIFLGVALCHTAPIPVIPCASANFWGKTYSVSDVRKDSFTLITIDQNEQRQRTYSFEDCPSETEIQIETISFKHIYTVMKYKAPNMVFSIGIDLAENTCYFRLGTRRVKKISGDIFQTILNKYKSTISMQFGSPTIVENIMIVLKNRMRILTELLDQRYLRSINRRRL